MAQAGANVIKVESLKGETLRSTNPKASATYPFALLNGNKKSLVINIKSEHGQQLIQRLAQKVDVISENFAPGTMAKYGMSMALAAAATADVRDALMVQVLSFQDALPETGARAAIHASTNKNLDNNKHIKEALG